VNRLSYASVPIDSGQLSLPLAAGNLGQDAERTLGVTFRDSLAQPVFGWYPYVEGFSAKYTSDAIATYRPTSVYDPFAGSGTTQLAASCAGIPSFYCEVNPFMRFVAETKVNAARWAHANPKAFQRICREYTSELTSPAFSKTARRQSLAAYEAAFPERDFFELEHLKDLLAAVEMARTQESNAEARDILLLACAANAVLSSNMTRRADLRRRRDDEYKDRVVDVPKQIAATVMRFMRDVERVHPLAPMVFVSPDARRLPVDLENRFELALTSPPYLNGTNYFRNTKIELWLLGFIASERELGGFRREAIAAGINNVTRARPTEHRFEPVEAIVAKLEATDGDMRIPLLVRKYCSDMHQVFAATRRALLRDGVFLLDIGDSRFYGVHVPTDALLIHVAQEAGLEHLSQRFAARAKGARLVTCRKLKAATTIVCWGAYLRSNISAPLRIEFVAGADTVTREVVTSLDWSRVGGIQFLNSAVDVLTLQFDWQPWMVIDIWGLAAGAPSLDGADPSEEAYELLTQSHLIPETFYLSHSSALDVEIVAEQSSGFVREDGFPISLKKCSYCERLLPSIRIISARSRSTSTTQRTRCIRTSAAPARSGASTMTSIRSARRINYTSHRRSRVSGSSFSVSRRS
jgi:hypothetical protein